MELSAKLSCNGAVGEATQSSITLARRTCCIAQTKTSWIVLIPVEACIERRRGFPDEQLKEIALRFLAYDFCQLVLADRDENLAQSEKSIPD